jgi:hypothetical protein
VYFQIISANDDVKLLDTTGKFSVWLGSALPYAALMIVGVIIVFVLNCIVIARTEEC